MSDSIEALINGPVTVVGCHAEGEVGDVVVGGFVTPPGATIAEQSKWIQSDKRIWRFLHNEPRGGVFRHFNLLVPAIDPTAALGFIIMEPEDTPLMSGSNSMCVATVAIETGIVAMTEPLTTIRIEAPAGVVEATAECRNGKVESVSVRNVASFADPDPVPLHVPGIGDIPVWTAWGGDSFVITEAESLGVGIDPTNGRELAELGSRVTAAANDQLRFEHPTNGWDHFSFCQIAGPLSRLEDGVFAMTNTVVVEPGKLDRSPTGTGVSARMALLHSQGVMTVGDQLRMTSIIGSRFTGEIAGVTTVGDRVAIVPDISGRAWRTGITVHNFDPTDPYPQGYRVSDTWPTPNGATLA